MKILQKEDTKLLNQGRTIGRNRYLQTRGRTFAKASDTDLKLPDARLQRTWNRMSARKKQKILDKVRMQQSIAAEEVNRNSFERSVFKDKAKSTMRSETGLYVPPEVRMEAAHKEAQKKAQDKILSDEIKLLVLDEYARIQLIESQKSTILCEEQEEELLEEEPPEEELLEEELQEEEATVTCEKKDDHEKKEKRHIMRRVARFAGKQYILGTEKEAEASERKQQEVFRNAGQLPAKVKNINKALKAVQAALSGLLSGPIGIAFLVFVCVFVVFIAIFGTMQTQTAKAVNLSAEVEGYRGAVREAAGRYEMSEYVELILAVMMQESGGRGLDPMQASEGGFNTRYPRVPNGITDPAYSIECGVQELKVAITSAKVTGNTDMANIRIALQAYNFGPGYIRWMERKGYVAWSFETACGYAESTGWGRRSNPNSAAGPWKYGDQYYPVHVLQYYEVSSGFWGAGGEAAQVPYEDRMAYLFPNGTPASASAMSPYLTTIAVPIVNENGAHTTMNLTVHQKLAGEIQQVFAEMEAIEFPIKASQTAGYNWRSMVSSGSVSHHSYGVAIDVNWNDNPYISSGLTVGSSSYQPYINRFSVTPEVIQIWKNHGFYWGGDWNSSKDYMHFSYTNH